MKLTSRQKTSLKLFGTMYAIILTVLAINSACIDLRGKKDLPPNPIVSCDSLHRAYDTLLVQHTDQLFIHIDSIQQLNILNARKTHKIDSLQHLTDSLSKALFLSNYRIHQARYYLKICVNNPSQTKFLKGWMNRALNE